MLFILVIGDILSCSGIITLTILVKFLNHPPKRNKVDCVGCFLSFRFAKAFGNGVLVSAAASALCRRSLCVGIRIGCQVFMSVVSRSADFSAFLDHVCVSFQDGLESVSPDFVNVVLDF